MSVILEKGKDNIAYVPCLAQLEEGGKFSHILAAINRNGIYLYSDEFPDKRDGDNDYYSIRKEIPAASINKIVKEKLINNREAKKLVRINIVGSDKKTIMYLFSSKKDGRYTKRFLKGAKKVKIKVKKKKVPFDSIV